MKNLLSENMLRFGTKNLSEAAQRELVLKSIMETINEHGLHTAVRQQLIEAEAPADPAWLTTAKNVLAEKNDGSLSVAILKIGATYTQPSDMITNYASEKTKFAAIAKGAKWYASPSLTVAFCAAKVYKYDDFGSWNEFIDSGILNNTTAAAQLAAGTYKYKGKPVTGVQSNVVWYPSLANMVSTAGGVYTMLPLGDSGDAMRAAMNHVEGQPYGPGAGTKYTPGG
jgi:hypothetical protein